MVWHVSGQDDGEFHQTGDFAGRCAPGTLVNQFANPILFGCIKVVAPIFEEFLDNLPRVGIVAGEQICTDEGFSFRSVV